MLSRSERPTDRHTNQVQVNISYQADSTTNNDTDTTVLDGQVQVACPLQAPQLLNHGQT